LRCLAEAPDVRAMAAFLQDLWSKRPRAAPSPGIKLLRDAEHLEPKEGMWFPFALSQDIVRGAVHFRDLVRPGIFKATICAVGDASILTAGCVLQREVSYITQGRRQVDAAQWGIIRSVS